MCNANTDYRVSFFVHFAPPRRQSAKNDVQFNEMGWPNCFIWHYCPIKNTAKPSVRSRCFGGDL